MPAQPFGDTFDQRGHDNLVLRLVVRGNPFGEDAQRLTEVVEGRGQAELLGFVAKPQPGTYEVKGAGDGQRGRRQRGAFDAVEDALAKRLRDADRGVVELRLLGAHLQPGHVVGARIGDYPIDLGSQAGQGLRGELELVVDAAGFG